jgi:hypothetical protein
MNPLNSIADIDHNIDTAERKPYQAPLLAVLGAGGTESKSTNDTKERTSGPFHYHPS